MTDSRWKKEAAGLLVEGAGRLDELIDRAKRRLRSRLDLDTVRQIQPYRTYGTPRRGRVCGRVFANKLPGSPQDDDDWWDNLLATYRRWRSQELAEVPVSVEIGGRVYETATDAEGYYRVDYEADPPLDAELRWHEATVRAPVDGDQPALEVTAKVLVPPPSARFGVISDLDDTVIHSNVSNLVTQAKLTFLNNAKTRKPLDGVGGLYRAFVLGLGGADAPDGNPIFYVSSSAWNLYDLLEDFLELNEIPSGPIQLQDVGIDRDQFIKGGHDHKLEKARAILDTYDDLPFILVGDSSQKDAALYLELARAVPERIRAIYIRNVTPGTFGSREQKVQAAASEAEALGVPMRLVPDSESIALHAVELGLILPSALDDVLRSRDRDVARPG